VVGWVEDPETLSDPAQGALRWIPARSRPPAPTHQPVRGGHPLIRNSLAQAVHRFFHRTASTGSARRSSPPPTPKAPVRCSASPPGHGQPAARRPGEVDFSRDFFGKETFLTVSGQSTAEAYALALSKVYTVRTDLPRREQPYHPPPGRVLDDRAGGRLQRPGRQRAAGEDFLKYLFRAVLDERMTTWPSSPSAVADRCDHALEAFINAPFERIEYTDAIKLLQGAARSSSSRRVGLTCRPSTSAG
jgi:asparaginyl-tRNA synthetase